MEYCFFSSKRRHTRCWRDWSSDVCSSDLRGLSGTKASYATLAEISFPASAVILNWVFLGVTVTANQLAGFGLLWAAILALGYLNALDPLPAPPVGVLGAERTG